jgi:hypothetical protein
MGWALVLLAFGVLLAGGEREAPPAKAQGTPPEATPTPLVIPVHTPAPLFLPDLLQGYDPLLPGPIESRAEGWLAPLTSRGRRACAPATHVLLRDPEGTLNNFALAVLRAAFPDPALNLDLFIGEYVLLSGTSEQAPDACDVVTWRSIIVEAIEEKEVPPR